MLLVIQGKVDDWRLQRRSAWKIVEGFRGSAEMPDIYNFYPLIYDDELRIADKKEQAQDLQQWYDRASQEMSNFKFN